MEMQETVTRDGMLILHLTHCAFRRKVGEEKSFYRNRTRKYEMACLIITWNMAGLGM